LFGKLYRDYETVGRFYARTSRHYVELDQNTNSKSSTNVVDGYVKRRVHLSRPANYPGIGDVTADHVTTGNGQYFVLDAEAVNREAFLSHQRDALQ